MWPPSAFSHSRGPLGLFLKTATKTAENIEEDGHTWPEQVAAFPRHAAVAPTGPLRSNGRLDRALLGTAENTARKQQIGLRFEPGQSGNPSGRPKGSRNKATLAVETLLDGEAEVITRKAIELAKKGDLVAIRLCLDRIAPPRKDRPIPFSLPALGKEQTHPPASQQSSPALRTATSHPVRRES